MQNIYTFPDFVAKFPPVTMPVTLGEDTHHALGTENEPIPAGMIEQFIFPVEGTDEADEFTEHIPCFSIEGTDGFIALVWWKAALLNYEYRLATFDAKGGLIAHRVIAYTRVKDGEVTHAVAIIDKELDIHVAEGTSPDGNMSFDPAKARSYGYEIMLTGEIE